MTKNNQGLSKLGKSFAHIIQNGLIHSQSSFEVAGVMLEHARREGIIEDYNEQVTQEDVRISLLELTTPSAHNYNASIDKLIKGENTDLSFYRRQIDNRKDIELIEAFEDEVAKIFRRHAKMTSSNKKKTEISKALQEALGQQEVGIEQQQEELLRTQPIRKRLSEQLKKFRIPRKRSRTR